ncbi:MAG: hypothetical protein R3B84_11670 [Zavarzinella sp.]
MSANNSTTQGGEMPPSLISVFLSEILKRKALVIFWLLVTAAAAFMAVKTFAKPVYRATGSFIYTPNYRNMDPLYLPPNIESLTDIIGSPACLKEVRQQVLPTETDAEFTKNLLIKVRSSTELVDASYDHADPTIAKKVVDEVMKRGLMEFQQYQSGLIEPAIAKRKNEIDQIMLEMKLLKNQYQQELSKFNITDFDLAMNDEVNKLRTMEIDLAELQQEEKRLKDGIALLIKRADDPIPENEKQDLESKLRDIDRKQGEISLTLNLSQVEEAKKQLEILKPQVQQYQDLFKRSIITRTELNELLTRVATAESRLQNGNMLEEQLKQLQKERESIKNDPKAYSPSEIARLRKLAEMRTDYDLLPGKITAKEAVVKQQQVKVNDLRKLESAIVAKYPLEMRSLEQRKIDLERTLNQYQSNSNPNRNDLKIYAAADAGSAPFSSNTLRLVAGVVGLSLILLLCYIAIFALPQVMPSRVAPPPRSGALVTIVPVEVPPAPSLQSTQVPEAQPVTYQQPSTSHIPTAPGFLPPVASENRTPPPTQEVDLTYPATTLNIPAPDLQVARPVVAEQSDSNINLNIPGMDLNLPDISHSSAMPMLQLSDLTQQTAAKPAKPNHTPQPQIRPPMPGGSGSKVIPSQALNFLAERIHQRGISEGGIVLFTPINHGHSLDKMLRDLGNTFTQNGQQVLIFDASGESSYPTWATGSPILSQQAISNYVLGRSQDIEPCFQPTDQPAVFFAQASINHLMSGVETAHRFQRLLNEMHDKFDIVLMLSPPISAKNIDPSVYTTLAEGIVVITERDATMKENAPWFESLRKQSTPVLGTLSLPKITSA